MLRRIMFFFLILSSNLVFSEAPEGYPFLSFDQAMKESSKTSRPIMVYFGRYGCGYCEKTNKEAFSVPQVKQVYTKHYTLAYVDSESGKRLRLPSGERITERELGTRYRASVTPVFTFLTSDGKKIHQLIGVQSKETLLKADQEVQHFLSKTSS